MPKLSSAPLYKLLSLSIPEVGEFRGIIRKFREGDETLLPLHLKDNKGAPRTNI